MSRKNFRAKGEIRLQNGISENFACAIFLLQIVAMTFITQYFVFSCLTFIVDVDVDDAIVLVVCLLSM